MTWRERALCAQTDPEAFFPEKGGSVRDAKKMCAACDVTAECRNYLLTHSDINDGVWAEMSPNEYGALRGETRTEARTRLARERVVELLGREWPVDRIAADLGYSESYTRRLVKAVT